MPENTAVADAPAVPAAEPAPAPSEPKKSVADSAFERLSKNNADPKQPAEEPAPETPPSDKVPADKGNGQPSEEAKKALEEMIAKGEYIPKHRFDEVLQRMKAFESFGTPEQLRTALNKLTELEKLPASEKKDAIDDLTPEQMEIREEMLKMFPALKDMPTTKAELDKLKADQTERTRQEIEQARVREQSLFKQGEDKIKTLCEKNGLDCSSDRRMKLHVGGVTDILYANKELADRFHAGDVDALQSAFDEYFKEMFSGFQRSAKADLLKGKANKDSLPKAPANGSAPAPEVDKPPKNLDEAGKRGWDRLNGKKA